MKNVPHAIWVEVHVKGEATDPEDEGVAGVYGHEVKLSRHLDGPAAMLAHEASAIASAVLDEFHSKQGISFLDDFQIEVRYFGTLLTEDPIATESDLVISATHHGKLSDDELQANDGRPRPS